MIAYDTHARRMVDTENGEYLLSQLANCETHEWYFNLYDRHNQPLLATIVQVNNIDESGNSGVTTLVNCVLRKTWLPSGRPEPPNYFDEYHPQIPRLDAFLEARLYASGKLNPQPRFEFIDGRNHAASTEAMAWAQSYQQGEQSSSSSSGKKRTTGKGVFLGLLLTLGLHVGYVFISYWLAQLLSKPDSLTFFFGFIQLVYMIPAILYFRQRDNHGIMMGLMIGAALTFMLGLPLAGLGIICGGMRGL